MVHCREHGIDMSCTRDASRTFLSDRSFTHFAQAYLAPVSVIRGAVTKLHAAIDPKQNKIEAIIIHYKTFGITFK